MSRLNRAARWGALATAAAALAVPSAAAAAWTAPVTVDSHSEANPVAAGAFGGSVLIGWFDRSVSLSRRSGDSFGAPQPITSADPFERVWYGDLAADGSAVVLTVRKHAPIQRVRATLVGADGSRRGPM